MEFLTIVMIMGVFYFLVFALAYVENILEQRRARNVVQGQLASGRPSADYSDRARTPSPNDLVYIDAATGRRTGPLEVRQCCEEEEVEDSEPEPVAEVQQCQSETGKVETPIKPTRPTYDCPIEIAQQVVQKCPVSIPTWPAECGQQTFECYPRGNQWICAPVDDPLKPPDTWDDSHESMPHCIHGQERCDVPFLRKKASGDQEMLDPLPSHQHLPPQPHPALPR